MRPKVPPGDRAAPDGGSCGRARGVATRAGARGESPARGDHARAAAGTRCERRTGRSAGCVRAGCAGFIAACTWWAPSRRNALSSTPRCSPAASCAYASHQTAATLYRLPLPDRPTDVHVTVLNRDVRRPGITVHRTRALSREETQLLDGIPTTSPARTIVDLAGELEPADLEHLLAQAYAKKMVTRAKVLAVVALRPTRSRRRGTLRRLLEPEFRPSFTRSEGGAALPRPRPEIEAPRAAGQRPHPGPRGRFLLAAGEPGRRGRRSCVPRREAATRARQHPRSDPDRARAPGPADHLAPHRQGTGGAGGSSGRRDR